MERQSYIVALGECGDIAGLDGGWAEVIFHSTGKSSRAGRQRPAPHRRSYAGADRPLQHPCRVVRPLNALLAALAPCGCRTTPVSSRTLDRAFSAPLGVSGDDGVGNEAREPQRIRSPTGRSWAVLLTWKDRCCWERIRAEPIWGMPVQAGAAEVPDAEQELDRLWTSLVFLLIVLATAGDRPGQLRQRLGRGHAVDRRRQA